MHAAPTYQLLAFLPLMAALVLQVFGRRSGPWMDGRVWAAVALALAVLLRIVDAMGVVVLLMPLALLWLRTRAKGRGPRLVLDLVLIHYCLALAFHKLPGIHNPMLFAGALSPESADYRLYWNLDKAFAAFYLLEIVGRRERPIPDRRYLGFAVLAILLAMGLAWGAGFTRPEPKWTSLFLWWAPANLLLVALPEETLFRLLLQDHVETRLKARAWAVSAAAVVAIVLAALLFGLSHFRGGWLYVASATVAGLGYGCAFRYRRNPWHPVLAHFGLNTLHFLVFVYPRIR